MAKDPILSALQKQTKAINELTKVVMKLNLPTLEVANGQFDPLPTADNTEKVSVPLENLETTTGQLPPERENHGVEREKLERALNINQTNIFGTTDFDTFKAKLNDMTYPSMQDLAEKLQLNKFETPPILKKQLEESFFSRNAAAGAMNKMPKPFVRKPLNPANPEDRKAMEALGMKF